MKKYELEQQMEETYTSRRKTAELQETYDYYSGIVAHSEELFWQDGYQSHYAPRFEMALDLTSRYRHHLVWGSRGRDCRPEKKGIRSGRCFNGPLAKGGTR